MQRRVIVLIILVDCLFVFVDSLTQRDVFPDNCKSANYDCARRRRGEEQERFTKCNERFENGPRVDFAVLKRLLFPR